MEKSVLFLIKIIIFYVFSGVGTCDIYCIVGGVCFYCDQIKPQYPIYADIPEIKYKIIIV